MPGIALGFRHAAMAWMAVAVLAIGNGLLREALLVPQFGRSAATLASGLLLMAAVVAVAWLLLRWRPARSRGQTWRVGLGWLTATVVFETAIGLMQGHTGSELLSAYAFSDGNLWPLVLVVVGLAPWLVLRLSGATAREARFRSR